MLRTTTARATAGLCAIAACGALAGPAAAADPAPSPVVPGVQQLAGDVVADTGAIVSGVVDQVTPAVRSVPWTVAALQRQVRGYVRRTGASATRTSDRLLLGVRSTGASTFAVVGRSGRSVSGPSAIAVSQPVTGTTDVAWGTDLTGCVQVAVATDRSATVLGTQVLSPFAVRVLHRTTTADLAGRGFVVAAYC